MSAKQILLLCIAMLCLILGTLGGLIDVASDEPCASGLSAFEASVNGGTPMARTWTEDGVVFTNPVGGGFYRFSLCHVPPGRTVPTKTRYGVVVQATPVGKEIYCLQLKD